MARLQEERADLCPLPQDLEPLLARDRDLQQLRQGLVVPAARDPLSQQQQLEAFDNYLHLVYGPALLVGEVLPHASPSPAPPPPWGSDPIPALPAPQGMHPRTESQQRASMALTVEKNWHVSTLRSATPSLVKAGVCIDTPKMLPPRDWGALSRRFTHPSQVTLPIPPTSQQVHSKASQVRPPTPATPLS